MPGFPAYGIGVSESHHSARFSMSPSRYPFSEIMLVLGGNGWAVHQEVRHPVQAQNLIIVPAGTSYHLEDDRAAPLTILCLGIRPPQPECLLEVLPRRFAVLRNRVLTLALAEPLRTILYEQAQSRPGEAAAVLGETLLLLTRLHRKSATGDEPRGSRHLEIHVRDYIERLKSSFYENEPLAIAAERLGISSRTLSAYFRKITGLSRHRYIQQLRLEHARRLLAGSDQSITSICFACGFEDLSTFFRAFRAREKLSPSQWREKHAAARARE